MKAPITVLKFGSSVLRSDADLIRVVDEIYRWVRTGAKVVAIVSAIGDTTDRLSERGRSLGEKLCERAFAELLSTGETSSAALLGIALGRAGIPARVVSPAAIELRTMGPALNAHPCSVNAEKIHALLGESDVVVVPGFFGQDAKDARVSLLGRGGSDFTAVFLAHQLQATRCRLLKDVDGIFEADPLSFGNSRKFARLGWRRALNSNIPVIQHSALTYAHAVRQQIEVSAIYSSSPTLVGTFETSLTQDRGGAPLRVALLGLGTVGGGVFEILRHYPEIFEIVGIAVRDVTKPERASWRQLLTKNGRALVDADVDVVVEVTGSEVAPALIRRALSQRKAVVTANKAAVVQLRDHNAFTTSNSALRYSAAVGGVTPMLELVGRLRTTGKLRRIEAILNGTTNFILDEIAGGADHESALREAVRRGFAEADPTADLAGLDAARKLRLLAEAAFGKPVPAGKISVEGIVGVRAEEIRSAAAEGGAIRLVASAAATSAGLQCHVAPRRLQSTDLLASVRGEENCLIAHFGGQAPSVVRGKGAGRWPTATAVVADLFDVAQAHVSDASEGADQTGVREGVGTGLSRECRN